MKRLELSILIGLLLAICTSGITGFAADCGVVRQESIRLHILADSNTPGDQSLKLQVRDAVLAEVGTVFTQANGKQEAVELARAYLPVMVDTATRVLRENGCDAPVTARVANLFFTTRQYGDKMMPAGRYDAVQILIGSGQGKNWWCVMFPPLCLPAAEGAPGDAVDMGDLLIPDKAEFQVKFAVVEAYETLKDWLTNREI